MHFATGCNVLLAIFLDKHFNWIAVGALLSFRTRSFPIYTNLGNGTLSPGPDTQDCIFQGDLVPVLEPLLSLSKSICLAR